MERVVTFDLETADWDRYDPEPIAIGMLWPDDAPDHVGNLAGEYLEWTNDECTPIEEMVDIMLSRAARNITFVAHNGGGFDFIAVLSEILRRDRDDVTLDVLTKGNGDVFRVEIGVVDGGGTSRPRYLQDSYHLLMGGLGRLSRDFLDSDEAKMEPKHFDVTSLPEDIEDMSDRGREEMLEYLHRDCTSLRGVLDKFTNIVLELTDGSCPPQYTAGSTTMYAYRTAFMSGEEVSYLPPDGEAEPHFREAYYGGRTEVFRQKAKADNLYHYDVNSLYPHAYTNFKLPCGPIDRLENEEAQEVLIRPDRDQYGGVVKIEATVPDVDVPVLPASIETDDGYQKVVFPTGDIEGWYMVSEVRYAQSVGALTDVNVLDAYVSRLGRPFENYGSALYQQKREINSDEKPAKYFAVKLLLNSFYGKFGMERDQTSITQVRPDGELEGLVPINAELEGHRIYEEPTESRSPYIIPRIAAAITARARIEMHKWFMRAKEQGGKVWYCDTDSIVTNVELPEGEDLGEMDKEAELGEAYFLRPKTYAERHAESCDCHDCLESDEGPYIEIKGKGMRDIEEQVSFEDFRKAFEDSEPGLIASEWSGVRGFLPTLKDGATSGIQSANYSRSLSGFDDKRDHHPDGTVSSPRVLVRDGDNIDLV